MNVKDQQSTEVGAAGLDGSVDRIRTYLVEQQVLDGETGTQDERIFHAGISCIELSMRPYDRRLLRRAIHDADRVQRIFTDILQSAPDEAGAEPLTPAIQRGLVSLIERDVHMEAGEGPVPFLFRSGVTLVGASYDISNAALARQAQRDLARVQASLDFMVDLLDWVESGRREDRIETLQQAKEHIDEIEKQVEARHDALHETIGRIEQHLSERLGAPQALPEPVERSIATSNERLRGLDATLQTVAGRTEALGALDGRLDAMQESLRQIESLQRETGNDDSNAEFERLAADMRRELAALKEPSEDLQQIRMMLIGALVLLIALVVLVIVL